MGTTLNGTRVPTNGDTFDVPADMLRMATDVQAYTNTAVAVRIVNSSASTPGIWTYRYSATSNVVGWLTIPLPAGMGRITGGIGSVETDQPWAVKPGGLSSPTTGMDFILYNVTTGAAIPNAAFMLNVILFGSVT